jgi:site-specific recombinase XerD
MTFTEYLQQKKYSPVTVDRYSIYSKRFLTWLAQEELLGEAFTYTDLLEFMRYCQNNWTTKRTVHNILCIVRHYCNYMISEK